MKAYTVIESRPSGVGTTLYVGELRTPDDRPIVEHLNGKPDGKRIYPVSVGVTRELVLQKLRERAAALRLDLVEP